MELPWPGEYSCISRKPRRAGNAIQVYLLQRVPSQVQGHGRSCWEITNRLFDRLPLCAVVGDPPNLFCAHGGIPHTVHTIEEINQAIPACLPCPQQECPTAWEFMWSDPLTPEQFQEVVNMHDPKDLIHLRPGYIFNTKRGTAFRLSSP